MKKVYYAEDVDGDRIRLCMKPHDGKPYVWVTESYGFDALQGCGIYLSAVLDVLRQAGFTVIPPGQGEDEAP